MTQAMILAAGQGTRVRPLTQKLPKPMVPILGKPVMEYLIEHLARYGVRLNCDGDTLVIKSYTANPRQSAASRHPTSLALLHARCTSDQACTLDRGCKLVLVQSLPKHTHPSLTTVLAQGT